VTGTALQVRHLFFMHLQCWQRKPFSVFIIVPSNGMGFSACIVRYGILLGNSICLLIAKGKNNDVLSNLKNIKLTLKNLKRIYRAATWKNLILYSF
jgi:hypothetical protein